MADAKGAYIGGVPVQFKDAAARAMISDEYNSAETYAKGNLCIYNGKIYEAIKETTGTWDATAWEETTLAKVNSKLNGDITRLTENEIITVSPISELKISNSKVEVRAGIALVNIQILCAGTTAVSLSNGKILATGFPKPSSGIAIITHGIPWNNGFTGSDARTIPLRLCIDGSGKLCCFYPSDKERITVGMPVNINCSYSVAD